MELEIKSRRLKKRFRFWKRDGGDHYIYLVTEQCPGTLGQQICENGAFGGHTISASDDAFEATCRNWYRARMRNALIYQE